MKVIFCFLAALLISFSTKAQTVSFDYDNSGNRESRSVIPLNSPFQSKSKIETEATKPIVDNIGSDSIIIYPNPVASFLNVNIQSKKEYLSINVKVIDQSGHIIISEKYAENTFQLDFSNLSSGIYFMIIEVREEHTKWKIIKE